MPKFRCEHCRQKIVAPDSHIGKRVRCPRCKQAVVVIVPVEAAPVAAAAPELPVPHFSTQMPAPETPDLFTRPAPEDISSVFGQWVTTYGDSAPGADSSVQEHETERTWQHLPVIDESRNNPASVFKADPILPPPVEAEFVAPPVEVFDRPARRTTPALDSAAEVADLLKTLAPPPVKNTEQLSAGRSGGRVAASAIRPAQQVRPVPPERAPAPAAVTQLGIAAIVLGVAAVGTGTLASVSRFAMPIGSAGAMLALLGGVVAARHRSSRIGLPAVGALACVAGCIFAMLGAAGIVPVAGRPRNPALASGMTTPIHLFSPTSAPSAEIAAARADYVPATSPLVAGGVEVRVASAELVQPVVYNGDWSTVHALLDRQLRITLELRDVGPASVNYRTWRRVEEESDDRMLSDDAGEGRPAIDLKTFVPVGGVTARVSMKPGTRIADVLLFEAPTDLSRDLKLDLPGANIDQPAATLRIRIPAGMVRVGSE